MTRQAWTGGLELARSLPTNRLNPPPQLHSANSIPTGNHPMELSQEIDEIVNSVNEWKAKEMMITVHSQRHDLIPIEIDLVNTLGGKVDRINEVRVDNDKGVRSSYFTQMAFLYFATLYIFLWEHTFFHLNKMDQNQKCIICKWVLVRTSLTFPPHPRCTGCQPSTIKIARTFARPSCFPISTK